jgi:hypothetical protein
VPAPPLDPAHVTSTAQAGAAPPPARPEGRGRRGLLRRRSQQLRPVRPRAQVATAPPTVCPAARGRRAHIHREGDQSGWRRDTREMRGAGESGGLACPWIRPDQGGSVRWTWGPMVFLFLMMAVGWTGRRVRPTTPGEAITSFIHVACTFQEKQPAAVSAIAHGIFPSAPVSFRSRWIEGLPGNYCGVGPVADRSSRVVSRNGREKGIAGARTSTAAATPSVGGQGRGGGAATAANLGRLAREA